MDYYGAHISTFRSVLVSNESVDPSVIGVYDARNNGILDHQRSVFVWYQHDWFQLRSYKLSELLARDLAARVVEQFGPLAISAVSQ
jgi:hypothetical protein